LDAANGVAVGYARWTEGNSNSTLQHVCSALLLAAEGETVLALSERAKYRWPAQDTETRVRRYALVEATPGVRGWRIGFDDPVGWALVKRYAETEESMSPSMRMNP